MISYGFTYILSFPLSLLIRLPFIQSTHLIGDFTCLLHMSKSPKVNFYHFFYNRSYSYFFSNRFLILSCFLCPLFFATSNLFSLLFTTQHSVPYNTTLSCVIKSSFKLGWYLFVTNDTQSTPPFSPSDLNSIVYIPLHFSVIPCDGN